jgi:uracil-DNA glycosylase
MDEQVRHRRDYPRLPRTRRSHIENVAVETAAPLVPEHPTLTGLKEAAADCTACPLHETGTQTVFGEGLVRSEILFVGEQPGDREDRDGRPFVGPAGRLLDQALEEVGIDRKLAYVTNVVKHFKWTPRGKRRIHAKPNWSEIAACRPWLDAEIDVVRPKVIVCLGATAAQALLGREFRVTRQRGEVVDSGYGIPTIATVHPSSILRAEDEDREQEFAAFVDDLAAIKRFVEAD